MPSVGSWVVYVDALIGAGRSICTQAEWDAVIQTQPGRFRLVKDKIYSEAEAEKIARGSPSETK